ncbi:alkaline phosphatase family protein [Phycicoccus sonneratiae]|uniref:Alkaline phosphatase family protein n=1 Tax=Phycicoccus sonneratiae TaxID=2807628 RepID=A0ABS2CGW5_9MICO|nr:alkaline phosphatase family protein [Phycicoccus sonneraticus]MBM6399109.1 alkaline phosphatase family protein [Phycicoccus sonneraticus]
MDRRGTVAAVAAALTAGTLALTPTASQAAGHPRPHPPSAPNRVLIVLFDQMVPQYADQFAMPNFRALRDSGTTFDKAHLGYMASETVMAHNVITSGLEPRHMGWTDEAYRDHANVFGKGADQMHITGDLSLADFALIEKNDGVAYPKLADYLHARYPGTSFITVGEKSYAVESATGASGDIAVRMSSRRSNVTDNAPTGCRNLSIPGVPGNGQWRSPAGKNVPAYLNRPDPTDPTLCGRYFVNADKANDYGTRAAFPSWLYPGEGNRFVPGNDPAHLGGDTWVADAAIEMMQRETWSGMFVTLGGIDKAAHMWGAQADTAPQDCTTLAGMTHTRCAAENADVQLGKLRAAVEAVDREKGGRTLVVLTADHGATYGETFLGSRAADAGNSNWYYAPPELGVWDAGTTGVLDTTTYSNPSPAIAALNSDGNVQFSYQSTAIETWLLDRSTRAKKATATRMLGLPGVIATYRKNAAGNHFVLQGTNRMTRSERSWWAAHAQSIVDTMAAPDGPDVVGLLHDRTSYGVYGDHGGAQESVQRVPMVFWTPGARGHSTGESFRTPDLLPTVLAAMGIRPTAPMDGRAHSLRH